MLLTPSPCGNIPDGEVMKTYEQYFHVMSSGEVLSFGLLRFPDVAANPSLPSTLTGDNHLGEVNIMQKTDHESCRKLHSLDLKTFSSLAGD